MYHESDYELLSRLCPISWCYTHTASVDHTDLVDTERFLFIAFLYNKIAMPILQCFKLSWSRQSFYVCPVFKSNMRPEPEELLSEILSMQKKSTYSLPSPLSCSWPLWRENNKLNASDVCSCGLINLCSKLLHHTISLPIDPQVLWGRAGAKVWRCGTSGGNRPRPNCLFFVSSSYWQLPLSQPLCPGKTKQGLLIAMAFSSSQIKRFHTS